MTAKDKKEIWDNMTILSNIADTEIRQQCEYSIYTEMKESINSILEILNEYKSKGKFEMHKIVKINNTTLEDSQLDCEFNRVKNESIKANFISHCDYKTIGKKFVEFQCGIHDGVYKIKANEIDLNGGESDG